MISVVTPTYFRNERLEEAIKSIKDQTFDGVEHIIIDGSEEEYAHEVVKNYDDLVYIAPDVDPGFNKCRELGVKKSKGEFIQFLDDDDQLRSTKLEKSLQKFEDDIGIVYCGLQFSESKTVILPDPESRGNVLDCALALNLFPAVPSTWTIRRSVLEEVMPFIHPDGADDEGMHIEFAQRTKYEFINEPLVVFGEGTENSFSATWEYVDGIGSLIDEYCDLYHQASEWVLRSALEKIHRKRAKMYMRDHYWHPGATWSFIQASRYSNDKKVKLLGMSIASLFGRPGCSMALKASEIAKSL